MFHVREFERWRDAPANQKGRIASDQVARHGIATLFPIPGDDPANVLGMKAGYGKVFRDCTSDELEEWMTWLRSLRDTARDQCEMISLQESCGGRKI